MALSVADAYAQIKNLENTGQLKLPQPRETVVMGTIDPAAGTFKWIVPTVVQTTVIPPTPPGKVNTFFNLTVGIVNTKAVDLRLRFNVIPQKVKPVNTRGEAVSRQAPAAAGTHAAIGTPAAASAVAHAAAPLGAATVATATAGAASTGAKPPAPQTTLQAAKINVGAVTVVSGLFAETNGGVTISGFPTVESAADHITVDAGLIVSTVLQHVPNVTPPMTSFGVSIDIPGRQKIQVFFFVLRPPVVGMGVFTIPALPMTIVYAPPQGVLKKNSVTYQDISTVSRTVSSSVTSSNNVKTLQAYSAADLIGKVAGAITMVAAVVGTGGAGAGAGASVAGALSQLGTALFGKAKEANDSTADAAKQVSAELSLVSGILNAVGEPTTSDANTVTVQNDQSLTITVTNMSQYGSGSALGPGVGDRIVYLRNVKVVWMAVNGEVGIHVLGSSGIGANAVQDLMQEKAILQGGGRATLGLDLVTIDALLNVDPIVGSSSRFGLFSPRIGPPRFVPADPPGRSGTTTSAGGDVFQASYAVATDSKHTVTNSSTTVTDNKPGWGAVLFGGADNTETLTTSTFTTSQVTDDKAEGKVTSTITLVSAGHDDPYDVKIFYDRTFGTYCVVDANSPLLQGLNIVGTLGQNVLVATK